MKKTSKQAAKHGASSGKAVNPAKLKQLIQGRDGKKETEDKTPTPTPSLLTRAGAARMNQDRSQMLFQNPESLTCNGFTMALRRTSLSWRLSQRSVVTPKPKKAPPSKSSGKQQCSPNTQSDTGMEHSEKDSVPNRDAGMSADTEKLPDEQSTCLVEGESREISQSWPPRVEDSQSCPSTDEAPAAEHLSGPPEGTHCEGPLSQESSDEVSAAPQEGAPSPQRSTPEVTSQQDTSNQLEDLGSQGESIKLCIPSLNPPEQEQSCFPTTSSFKLVPELDLKACMSLDGSIYPTALIKLLLAGSQPDVLHTNPQEETLRTTPDEGGRHPDEVLIAASVLGPAFSTSPQPWGFPGANLVPGEDLTKVSGSPEDLGAVTTLNQQETMGVAMGVSPDLPIFLPQPPNPVATYSSSPSGPEPHSSASCGLEVQGALPIATWDSGHTPQTPPISVSSSIPPVIAANSIKDETQLCVSPFPANTQWFTIVPQREPQHAPLDLTQSSQAAAPSKLEGGISQVSVTSSADGISTGMPMPLPPASAFSGPCKSTPPRVEKRKRKPCGVCGPCQQKANCGECTYCKNRKNSHQICKKRKCEVLKKKPDATTQVQVRKQARD